MNTLFNSFVQINNVFAIVKPNFKFATANVK